MCARGLIRRRRGDPSGRSRTPDFRAVREFVFAVTFSFEHKEYMQMLTDIATRLRSAVGLDYVVPALFEALHAAALTAA